MVDNKIYLRNHRNLGLPWETIMPEIENPYPQSPWSEITDFDYATPLWLYRGRKALKRPGHRDPDYLVGRDYTVTFKLDGVPRSIIVPKGLLTDLASVPRCARWIVGRVGRHLEASIVHDFLYVAWQDIEDYEARREDKKFADALMREGLKEAKISCVQMTAIRIALWAAGWSVYKSRNPEPRYGDIPEATEEAAPTPPSEDDGQPSPIA